MLKVALYSLGGVIFYFVKTRDSYTIKTAEELLEDLGEESPSIERNPVFKITAAFMSLLWPLWIIPNLMNVIFLRSKRH